MIRTIVRCRAIVLFIALAVTAVIAPAHAHQGGDGIVRHSVSPANYVDAYVLAIMGAEDKAKENAGGVVVDAAEPVYLTPPYLQNFTTGSMMIMWEMNKGVRATVEYGKTPAYGMEVKSVSAINTAATYIYRAEITGLEADTTYHFRVLADGIEATGDRTFTTASAERTNFTFGVWSDSQGFNRGAFEDDPLEPTKTMMAHMADSGVDFGVTAGDLAEDGGAYIDTRNFYLDRIALFLGAKVPWFNAWGNHDKGRDAILRQFADMPSKWRTGYTPGWGSFSFDYGGCHFICIDNDTEFADIKNWLESDLQSPAARNARFTFLFIHVPPYCELWIDGEEFHRRNLVPLMEKYGVDACFSGHTHEYERGYQNDIYYCITGGGSWLDWGEPVVKDWPHMTVGGAQDLPGREKGLVNEYVRVEVTDNYFKVEMHAFEPNGEYIGVLDSFGATYEDSNHSAPSGN